MTGLQGRGEAARLADAADIMLALGITAIEAQDWAARDPSFQPLAEAMAARAEPTPEPEAEP